MLLKRFLYVSTFLFFPYLIFGQYYDVGQDPAGIKWKIIKTEHFKIIFPEEVETLAQHVAKSFEQIYELLSADMKIKPVKIPVVIHNRSVYSNAEVPWAPKRIEFYLCPSQDDYAQPWIDQLVLHEFRHVVHYSKINQGLTKILSYVFGQQITAAVLGTFVPLWFIEGDAVCTETAFSNSGRGRVPAFSMKLKAQVIEKGIYNYNKAVFGSYKDFTANRYELGYQLVSYGQKHYSTKIWERAMDKSGKLPIMFVPFHHGIKKTSGLNKTQLYQNCMKELIDNCKKDHLTAQTKTYTYTTTKNKFYTDYLYVSSVENNSIISVKSGIDDITRFVKTDASGKEKKIFTPGEIQSNSFSIKHNTVYWAETAYDPRWDNRTYSVIKSINLQTGKYRQLTRRTRYFAPSANPEGSLIACTETTEENKSYIVILDAATGSIKKKIPADSADFIMTPRWSNNPNDIVYIALNKNGKRICITDTAGNKRNLTSPYFIEIAQPCLYGKHVFFVGSYTGIDNIYALDTTTKQIFQITSAKYGVSAPTVTDDGQYIFFSEYTADGFKPAKLKIDEGLWLPLEHSPEKFNTSLNYLFDGKAFPIDFYTTRQNNYPAKRYSKFLNLFNIHSWGPLSINADNETFKPGFEVKSQNLLSTMIFSAGYEHEWNRPQSSVFARMSYRGWYPQVDLEYNYYFNQSDSVFWDVMSLYGGISVPLNLIQGKNIAYCRPQIRYGYHDVIPVRNFSENAYSGSFHALEYRIYAYHFIKTSKKDFNPRWGQIAEITYKHTIFNNNKNQDILGFQSVWFFPGIGKHHSISIYAAWQHKTAEKYIFNDIISYPHGYDSSNYRKALSTSFSYQMPLFYPDWSIGSLLYIKRFRSALYYNFAYVTDKRKNFYALNSSSIDLLADFHLLRFLAPISMGIRLTYRFDNHKILPEFLYSINFDQIWFRRSFSRACD